MDKTNSAGTDRRTFLKGTLAGMAAAVSASCAPAARIAPGDDPSAAPGGLPRVLTDALRTTDDSSAKSLWQVVREQFLLEPGLTYLNTAGLGPSPRSVIDTLCTTAREFEKTSESFHGRIDAVRELACRYFNCDCTELALTRNTTEGMNCIAAGLPLNTGDEILLTTHEHPGGSLMWLAAARRAGGRIVTCDPGTGGEDSLAKFVAALTPRTRVVSFSHITCTTGTILPAKQLCELCRERGIISVIDGAQAAGQIPVDFHDLGCDFYATSGHKWLFGPKGSGILYVDQGMLGSWQTPLVGAYSDTGFDLETGAFELLQEARAVEYGTRSTPEILSLGAALEFADALTATRIGNRSQQMGRYVRKRLGELAGIEIVTPADHCAAITSFRDLVSERTPWDWCNELKTRYHIRLRPVGEADLNVVRISPHVFNSHADIDHLVAAMTEMLN